MTRVSGQVIERTDQNGFGSRINDAQVEFWNESTGDFAQTTSSNGGYTITLPEGRYWREVTHPDFESDWTDSGFVVVRGTSTQANVFLHRRGGTASQARASDALDRLVTAFPGELGVFATDLVSGRTVGANADTPFYLASIAKVPIAVGAVAAMDSQLALDEQHTIELGDYREEGKFFRYHNVGQKVTYRELLRRMIRNSDTIATDMVVRIAGRERINNTLADLGIDGLNPVTSMADLDRITWANHNDTWARIPDAALEAWRRDRNPELLVPAHLRAPPRGGDNFATGRRRYRATGLSSATPRAMAELAERIAEKRVFGGSFRDDILRDVIMDAGGQGRIGNVLRDADDVVDAKGGGHDGVKCDLALVYEDNTRSTPKAVVGVFAQDFSTGANDAVAYLREAARLAYTAIGKTPQPRPAATNPLEFARPRLGAFFETGQRVPVRWVPNAGSPARLDLDLVRGRNATFVERLGTNATDDGEWHSWTVPTDVPPGPDYRFRLTDRSTTPATTTFSDYFALRGVINVPEPHLGETHATGTVPEIRWSTLGVTGQLGIEVITRFGGGTRRHQVTRNANDDGEWHSWTVPETALEGWAAQVRVWSISDPAVEGISSEFRIGGAISVTTPTHDDAFAIGSTPTIRWETEDVDGPLVIELFRGDDTRIGPPITTNATDDGEWHSWTVPEHIDDGLGYRIQVRRRDAPGVVGSSDYFTLGGRLEWLVPSAEQAPFGSDELQSNDVADEPHVRPRFFAFGETPKLRWRTHGHVDGPLRLELLRHGQVVKVLTNQADNDGEWHSWTVSQNLMPSAGYQFRLSDANRNTVVADSQPFSIGNLVDIGLPRLPTGVGGPFKQRTTIRAGSMPAIRWRTENVTGQLTLALHQLVNGRDKQRAVITRDANDDGEWHSWTVPATLNGRPLKGRMFRFRLSSNENPSVHGFSPWFRIT